MTPDEWQRVKEVLACAVTLDETDQKALIEREFPDDASLREYVAELLVSYTLVSLRLPGLRTNRGAEFALPSGAGTAVIDPEPGAGLVLEPGDICGRYQVERQIGSGGMARVYLATDTELSTPVALKVLSEDLLDSSEARIRLRGEAHNAAKLRGHPHIATLLDLTHVDVRGRQFPVIVMEYVEGRSCAEHLAEHPVSLKRALKWAIEIADAVEYAHDRGVLHCDLKPQNIQVTADDSIKVLDFGVARALYGPSTAEIVTGTLPYMAPEQICEKRFTEAGDIYSLGVSLFELLTRRRPFAGETQADLVVQILGLPAPRASAMTPDLPEALDALVARTMAKGTRERPQSMAELRRELAGILAALGPQRVFGRVSTLLGAASTLFFALTFVGFVTSMIFDLALGRTGRFADESPLWWPFWGARMLIAPLTLSAFFLAPVVASALAVRWVGRRAGWSWLARATRWFGSIASHQIALFVLLASVLAVNLFFWRFEIGLQALKALVSDSVSPSITWLRPENFTEHNVYRYVAFLICFASAVCWALVIRRRPQRLEPLGIVLPMVGAVVMCLQLGLWALPYRLLWQAEREKVHLGSEPCYVVGRQPSDLLLFCPKSAPPRARVVSLTDARLKFDSLIERIFTEFDTGIVP